MIGAKMRRNATQQKVSVGNVFEDLGLAESGELLAKAELARQIAGIIARRRLTQAEFARILSTTQSKVSDLLRGKLQGFSMERLIRFLNALDRDVQIVVTAKAPRNPRGRLWVAARSRTGS
jgi:predicted XRE-type DNA-binding protein